MSTKWRKGKVVYDKVIRNENNPIAEGYRNVRVTVTKGKDKRQLVFNKTIRHCAPEESKEPECVTEKDPAPVVSEHHEEVKRVRSANYLEGVLEQLSSEFDDLLTLADHLEEAIDELDVGTHGENLLKLTVNAIRRYDRVLDSVAAA